MKSKTTKSKIVLDAECIYKDLNLECVEVVKSLDEIERTNFLGEKRKYIIPAQVYYRFSYNFNGNKKEIEVVRKAGNSKPLTTNIRTEIAKQIAQDLKEMEGWRIFKGFKIFRKIGETTIKKGDK